MSASETGQFRMSPLTPRERLLGLIRQILGNPAATRPLAVDARLADLGISSIKMVILMLAIEAEFNLTIPPGEITPESFASIASVEAMVERVLAAPAAPG